MSPRVTSNLWSSCLSLPSAGIAPASRAYLGGSSDSPGPIGCTTNLTLYLSCTPEAGKCSEGTLFPCHGPEFYPRVREWMTDGRAAFCGIPYVSLVLSDYAPSHLRGLGLSSLNVIFMPETALRDLAYGVSVEAAICSPVCCLWLGRTTTTWSSTWVGSCFPLTEKRKSCKEHYSGLHCHALVLAQA
jgi:hypothetical protein